MGRHTRLSTKATTNLHPIPKALAYFFVQTLEASSNTLEFIVKRDFRLMSIITIGTINEGRFIYEKIKAMVDVK